MWSGGRLDMLDDRVLKSLTPLSTAPVDEEDDW
jgi:hypothetical protein